MKVIGYARVSTEEQATQGVSLAAQVEKLRGYAQLYELDLVEIVEDGGFSGKSLQRPGLQRVLEQLRAGGAQGLLVAKLDRLTRSVSDMATLIGEYFGVDARAAAKLLSVADQVDTRTAAGILVLNVLTAVAQWERQAIGERTKAALQHLKAQGIRLGAPPLEDEGIIGRVVELRLAGHTLRQIAHTMEAEGRPTLRGGRWAAETARKILARKGVV